MLPVEKADGPARRPRRRATEIDSAVLQAAIEELTERGYGGFTMDRVAARAGTNKTVIYRRWPSRTALAFAAYKQMVGRPQSPPDTGELRSDVLELLRSTAARMSSSAGTEILRGLMMDARSDPGLLAGIRDELAEGEPGVMLAILARAVARGEARQEALVPRIATLPIALLRNEYLMGGTAPISDQALIEIIDQVFLPLVRPR
ncbi:TetR/AcrR family transcriptional regulator [Actinomadura montaniterrae]|uniref:TetR/AcrR family transcriptional regulator n=1 Tax=Actinomadura montaniterrae TaxID=1803903 RepID=A0A6L3WA45_9ACTN|nr:TetR/AcrR family transcriptional regulator [Actinomadura montaniterrae]KAB2388859.1 TetR/AcrR family transcriptional regulator [Actinomadura montaniterrae]